MAGRITPSKCSFALVLLLQIIFVLCDTNQDDVLAAQEISKETFERKMEAGDFLLVNFVGPGCKNCKEFTPIFNKVHTELLKERSEITATTINNMELVRYFDFQKLPSLVFFRKTVPILYEGHPEVEEIQAWLGQNRELHGRQLKDEDFEHLTQASSGSTTGDWLVQFCDPERPQCIALKTIWETVAYRLKGQINVAMVDTTTNSGLVKRFKIAVDKTPTVILFHQGKQFPYGLFHFGIASLVHFAEKSYKHTQGSVVIPPPAPFLAGGKLYKIDPRMITGPADRLERWVTAGHKTNKAWAIPRERTHVDDLTENIANKLRAVQPEHKGTFVIIVGGLVVLSVVLFMIFGRRSPRDGVFGGLPKKGV